MKKFARFHSSKIYYQSVEATKLAATHTTHPTAPPTTENVASPKLPTIEDVLRRPDEASLRIGEAPSSSLDSVLKLIFLPLQQPRTLRLAQVARSSSLNTLKLCVVNVVARSSSLNRSLDVTNGILLEGSRKPIL